VARHFLAGLLAGLGLLFRPDIAPAVVLSSLPFLWVAGWRNRGHYAAGMGLGLLPLGIITLLAGVSNVWDNLFFYPVLACNAGRRLPLFAAEPYVLNLLILHLLGSLAVLVIGLLELRKDRASKKGLVLLSMAALAFLLTPQATQRLDLGHLLFAGVVSLPFLALAFATFSERRRVFGNGLGLVSIIAAIALIETAAPELTITIRNAFISGLGTRQSGAIFVEQGGRSFPFGSPASARSAASLFEKVETLSKPGERLFVGPRDLRRTNYSDTYIYHLFPRLRPATYFLEMNPFSANRPGSRLATDIASADWLILNRAWDNWHEPNRSGENGEETPNLVVQDQFVRIAEYGPFELFQHKPASQGRP
jgi:hypothetical protein